MNRLINNTSTTSKRSLWPVEYSDYWVVGAQGSQLVLGCSSGNPIKTAIFDDWASGLGSNTLGYDTFHDRFSPATSLPSLIEHDFAEQFCTAMDTEAVRFFKSGSDAVSCAVRLARGFTDRRGIIVFDKSYHGTGDWFGKALWTQGGIVVDHHALMVFPFGQLIIPTEMWRNWDYGIEDIAAIVLEPVPKSILIPATGWLQHLREVCNEHSILLISDEIILGYRHHLRGYLRTADIVPDLSCYGKAMAQGAALSACTGRADIMTLLTDRVHFSGTNNGEWMPLAIAQQTLHRYQADDICTQLSTAGWHLKGLLAEAEFETRGLDGRFEVVFDSAEQRMSATRHCWQRKILFPGFCSMAVTHTEKQMQQLVAALREWRDEYASA